MMRQLSHTTHRMLPRVTTPLTGPETILLNDERFSDPKFWKRMPPVNQAAIIKVTEEFIDSVLADGSPEFMEKLHFPRDFKKDHMLERFYWQLAQCYRYSTPSRIVEAVPALEFIDIFPTLYLGVALSKKPGQEEKAIKIFQGALGNLQKATQMPVCNLLWARAHFSRVLRKKNRVAEAKKQEKLIREWILGHPYFMAPSELKELVIEDGKKDYIFSHPQMKIVFDQMEEVKDPVTGSIMVIDRRMGVTLM